MDDTKLTECVFEISSNLAALRANMDTVLSKMNDLDHRLTILETKVYSTQNNTNNTNNTNNKNFKDELIMLLAKSVIIGLTIIGSLSGVGTIIAKMFGA